MKELGYGKDYKYAHSFKGNFTLQEFLPDKITETKLYTPQDNPHENKSKDWLIKRWGKKYKY